MQTLLPPLIPSEVALLRYINGLHCPVMDALMYMLSNPGAWVALMAVLLYVLFRGKPWQEGALVLLSIALCILVCDGLSSGLAKPFFARPRPTHLSGLGEHLHIVYGYRGGPFGFFSGHASNFTACAVVLCRLIGYRRHTLAVAGIVTLVIYSRLYLGVHFVSDVVAGVAIGGTVGYIVSLIHTLLRRRLSPLGYKPSHEVFAPERRLWLSSLALFVLALVGYALQVAHILKMTSQTASSNPILP